MFKVVQSPENIFFKEFHNGNLVVYELYIFEDIIIIRIFTLTYTHTTCFVLYVLYPLKNLGP